MDLSGSRSIYSSIKTSPPTGQIPELVPRDGLSTAAYRYVEARLPSSILAHSLRVFFYAEKLSRRPYPFDSFGQRIDWHESLPLLFVACMFHDFGAAASCDGGPWRFEVEGADAAVAFLKSHGITETHAVWTAIACHTSPHIADRISPLARLLRYGPLTDFHRHSPNSIRVLDRVGQDDGQEYVLLEEVQYIENLYPRNDIEKVLADRVVDQARDIPSKAPEATWPGALLASADANPGFEGINSAF